MSETKFTEGVWEFDKYRNLVADGELLKVSGVSFPCGHSHKEVEANMNLIAAAPEMYAALESTNSELQWALCEINRLYKSIHSSRSLDEPKNVDMETCHTNMVLLAKARGEL